MPFWQDFLSEVGAIDSPGRGVQLRADNAHLFLENERVGMSQLSHGMNPQSGKTFGGSLVDAPDISDLRDGPDLFLTKWSHIAPTKKPLTTHLARGGTVIIDLISGG